MVAAAILTGAAGAAARADEPGSRELEAKTACLAGHLDKGIEILARLYAETNDPTYIYNQGRCFEQNGRASEALTRFREYLRKAPGLAAEENAQVQAHIAEMEQQVRQAALPQASPLSTTPPARGPGQADGQAAGATGSVGATSADGAAVSAGNGHGLRVAGVVTASVGLVALAGGVYMGAHAASLSKEVTNDANKSPAIYSSSKYDDGKRAETLQWVGIGVGSAALIAGGVLYYVGLHRSSGEAQAVAIVPTLGLDGSGGGVLRMVF